MDDLLLKVHKLEKIFPVKAGAFSSQSLQLKAVDKVSLDLKKGEILGMVGESGCGKTTFGRSVNRIYDGARGRVFMKPNPTVVSGVTKLDSERETLLIKANGLIEEWECSHVNGSFLERTTVSLKKKYSLYPSEIKRILDECKELKKQADQLALGSDVLTMPSKMLRENRRHFQMIFQDPWASLNPRMLIKDIIAEGPLEYGLMSKGDTKKRVQELLDIVGLPSKAGSRYPHEFSGGQRQRIGIARALALNPSLIICDEPVSALDVSIQAQVLNLLIQLQKEYDLTYIFIAHDLSVVQYISDRVAVMYLGKIVEIADAEEIYSNPKHPYTISLMSSVPVADPNVKKEGIILEGDVPSPVNPPKGCSFHPRCQYRTDRCSQETPELIEDENGHSISCFNPPSESNS